jgi:hypothetical protein
VVELYISLIVVFLIQESVSSSAVILQARDAGIGWVTIHSIWFLCSLLGTVVPYYIGIILLRHKFFENKLRIVRSKTRILLGRHGMALGLILLGLCNLNELNGLIAALLQIRLRYALPFFFIGYSIWYASVLVGNVISNNYIHTGNTMLISATVTSLVVSIFIVLFLNIKRHGKSNTRVKRG